MHNADDLVRGDWPRVGIKGKGWFASRPIPGPFLSRLADAWAVLIGGADAIRFEDRRPKGEKEFFNNSAGEIIEDGGGVNALKGRAINLRGEKP